jgi:hypothetical protein
MMSLNTTKQLIQPTQLLGLGDRGLLPQAPLILPINLYYLYFIPAIEVALS